MIKNKKLLVLVGALAAVAVVVGCVLVPALKNGGAQHRTNIDEPNINEPAIDLSDLGIDSEALDQMAYVTHARAADMLRELLGCSDSAVSELIADPTSENNLTRAEAAAAMAHILELDEAQSCNVSPSDASSIPESLRGYVYALLNAGYMTPESSFMPNEPITYSDFTALLNEIFGKLVTSGTNVTHDIFGAVLVTDSATLKDINIIGDLILAEKLGSKTLTLDNVSVSGKTVIRSGNLTLNNGSLVENVLARALGKTAITTSDSSLVRALNVKRQGGQITVSGNLTTVSVNCRADVQLAAASVKTVQLNDRSILRVDGDSYVETADLNADGAQLVGVGMVGAAKVNADNCNILTSKTKVIVTSGVNGTTVAGEAVDGGKTVTSPDNTEEINSTYTYTVTEITEELDTGAEEKKKEEEEVKPITVYFAADAFILGNGVDSFLVNPVKLVDISASSTAADVVTKQLSHYFDLESTGSVSNAYYLAALTGAYDVPDTLHFDRLPSCLRGYLSDLGYTNESGGKPFFDGVQNIGRQTEDGRLGEFDYTTMSGWMYSVNGIYPNVGMSEYTLSDGDVIRLSYTLWGYGADIGGGYAAGGAATIDFYPVANLSEQIRSAAESKTVNSSLLNTAKKIRN